MRISILATVLALALCGCESVPEPPLAPCPEGQEHMRTAQMFFGQNVEGKSNINDAEFRQFVEEEVTPRFPAGLTVLDGGAQWKGSENKMIREASKVLVLVLPQGEERQKLSEVRQAYMRRFHQTSVLLVMQQSCVSL
jgi:hypothetical protein